MADVQSEAGSAHIGLPALGDSLDFLRLVWAVDHALQRRSKSMALTFGITGQQRLLIRIVGRFPSVHAKQLAATLHLHPSSLTALLKRLERRGLIRRLHDGRDRRRLLLGLTRRGQALNGTAPGTIEAAVQRTLDGISKRDLRGARVALEALARTLDAPEPGPPARSTKRSQMISAPA